MPEPIDLPGVFDRYRKSVYFEHFEISGINCRGLDDRPLLHIAISFEDLASVKLLLQAGADPNILRDMRYTSLHEAVYYRQAEAVALLLHHGADGSLRSEFGQTAYDLAKTRGETKMLTLLRPNDLRPNDLRPNYDHTGRLGRPSE
ncbi:ankyrin repeat domain-containing protein [Pseudophaeobacter sp.]|uniref:ankyrin repeat domain-containing protein n=1 Tax=Pseudophaeobacter sp. TaxID=1971739 RepID=UPI0032986E06